MVDRNSVFFVLLTPMKKCVAVVKNASGWVEYLKSLGMFGPSSQIQDAFTQ